MKTKINQQNAQINSGQFIIDQSLQHVSAPQSKPSSGSSKSLRVTKLLYWSKTCDKIQYKVTFLNVRMFIICFKLKLLIEYNKNPEVVKLKC